MTSRRYAIRHRSSYRYHEPVVTSHHLLRLLPRSLPCQQVERFRLLCRPEPSHLVEETDYFGNRRHRCQFTSAYQQLDLIAASVVSVRRDTLDARASVPWDAAGAGAGDPALVEWRLTSALVPLGKDFSAYAAPSFPAGRCVLEAALDLTRRIHADFAYDADATTIATPVAEVLATRRGVCQDFAHLMLACLRAQGLPGRYVSGYLETSPPPGQPRLRGTDASHAWCAVHDPALGWIDCDPTNGCLIGQRHVTLAWGRDYADVSPVTGIVLGGGAHGVNVGVDVIPESEWNEHGIDGRGVFAADRG